MPRPNMSTPDDVSVRRATKKDADKILDLIVGLAEFERLKSPDSRAKTRLVKDIFARKLAHIFVAEIRGTLVGYALYFYTYSSFLARRTLFLEDIFVRRENRRDGVGKALFLRCVREAATRGCGRMQWEVLRWNTKAMRFYENFGAKKIDDLFVFRLDEKDLRALYDSGATSGEMDT